MAPTTDAEARAVKLGYVPALDGLRALAVVAVLLYHDRPDAVPGGFLGVSLFFTLSGFLITGVVMSGATSSGTVRLRDFWARRARRLLPASWLALLLALVVTANYLPAGQRLDAVGDVRAALLNVANWHFIAAGTPYADLVQLPSPVQHYWSLAIEEQFYVVFPVLIALTWHRRRLLGAVLAAAMGLSLFQQLHLTDLRRIYFGTDTRVFELAAGCALALLWPHLMRQLDRSRLAERALEVAGFVAVLGAAVAFRLVTLQTEGLYHGGFAALAVLWVVVIAASCRPNRLSGLLGVAPARSIGRISYGIYLFHFPLFLALTPERTGLSATPLLAVRLAVTLGVAAASFVILEQPIRQRRRLLRPATISVAFAGGAFAVLVASFAVPSPDTITVAKGYQLTPPTEFAAADEPAASPNAPSRRVPRLLIVGDSTAQATGRGLQAWGARTGAAKVWLLTKNGCTVLPGARIALRPGWEQHTDCSRMPTEAARVAREVRADAIVVFIGAVQLAKWKYDGMVGWHTVDEPVVTQDYLAALRSFAGKLAAAHVPVLWADDPAVQWDPNVYADMVGHPLPGHGAPYYNDVKRQTHLFHVDAVAIPQLAGVDQWAYTSLLEDATGVIPTTLRPDGLHLSLEAATQLAPRIFDVLLASDTLASNLASAGVAPQPR